MKAKSNISPTPLLPPTPILVFHTKDGFPLFPPLLNRFSNSCSHIWAINGKHTVWCHTLMWKPNTGLRTRSLVRELSLEVKNTSFIYQDTTLLLLAFPEAEWMLVCTLKVFPKHLHIPPTTTLQLPRCHNRQAKPSLKISKLARGWQEAVGIRPAADPRGRESHESC